MIRVTVVHEIDLVCNTLASVLREEADIEVVGLASSLEDAQACLLDTECDVLLLNAGRPSRALLQFIHQSSRQDPDLKVLVMGIAKAPDFIIQCFQAGTAGYVLRDETLEDLKRKIRAAFNDETVLCPQIAGALVSRVAELSDFVGGFGEDEEGIDLLHSELTRREREVLGHIERGHSNQEIADALIIEVGTVKNHVHNILKKLNVESRKHAAILARQMLPEPQPKLSPVPVQAATLPYNNRSLYRRSAERAFI
ncbi:MAG: response regulator transcription factor [Caldilineaceae bacterium]